MTMKACHLCIMLMLQLVVGISKPNIVFYVADDMGSRDAGYIGSEVPTPNLDALAYAGVILTRHYAQPVCSPARAALLTGKYPFRLGMQGWPVLAGTEHGVPLTSKLLPEYLKELNYKTHLVGKWHLGYHSKDYLPTRRGFDTFFGFLNGFAGYYDGAHRFGGVSGLDGWRNEAKAWPEFHTRYLPQLISEEAVKVINASDDNPFFLLVTTNAPHTGQLYWDTLLEPPPRPASPKTQHIKDPRRRNYAEIISYVDETLGNITEALKAKGKLDNTIIVFLSDNGAPSSGNMGNSGSNYPLRGIKASVFDGGVRVPAVLWSSTIQHKVLDDLFHISDWVPTLLAAVGGNRDLKDLDGINQWDSIAAMGSLARTNIIVEIDKDTNNYAYIEGNLKIVKNSMYDVRHNSFEGEYTNDSYDVESVLKSKVAAAIGGLTEESAEVRDRIQLPQRCSAEEQATAMRTDCSQIYCLYDLSVDPHECHDVSRLHTNEKAKMVSVLESYFSQVVPKSGGKVTGAPGENNYWEPWIESRASTTPKLALFTISVPLLLFNLAVDP